MINSVSMKNFRKHRSATLQFGPGLTVVRGGNEAGKSTGYEAIAYALFGVGALRTPLDKAVTWGEPVNSLKVDLDLTVDHVTYVVTRSKSGAEVNYPGGIVTGQKEVTNFMAKALRMDVGSAQRLVLSNQKEIAGALEAGTKATTELIERLAEFHQIDKLVDLMQEKLTLGSAATAEAALASAQSRLAEALAVQEPDMVKLQSNVDAAQGTADQMAVVLETAQAASDAAASAHAKVAAVASEHADLDQREARLQRRYEAAMNQMYELKRATVDGVPDADDQIQKLLAQKADLAKNEGRVQAYNEVHPLIHTEVNSFLGTQEQLEAEISALQRAVAAHQAEVSKNEVKIATLRASINAGSCGFCGQDFSEVPEVIAKNALAAEEIVILEDFILVDRQKIRWIEEDVRHKETFKVAAKPFLAAARRHAQYLKVDDTVFPPKLEWTGGDFVKTPVELQSDGIEKLVRQIRTKVTNNAAWLQSLKDNATLLDSMDPERQSILSRRAELGPLVPADDLVEAAKDAADTLRTARRSRDDAVTALNEAKGHLRDAQRDWERTLAERIKLEKTVAENQEGIRNLEFNNALLKRVRAARPVIGDRLWNLVLTSVSSYFSEMRGVASTVTKGPDGFLVDGEPVESFSGSTIDVLGLAIRVALVRTFLPTAPFLILDEPASACSDERTSSLLGFVVGAGFRQILLATHEEVSESVADSIITLGETA